MQGYISGEHTALKLERSLGFLFFASAFTRNKARNHHTCLANSTFSVRGRKENLLEIDLLGGILSYPVLYYSLQLLSLSKTQEDQGLRMHGQNSTRSLLNYARMKQNARDLHLKLQCHSFHPISEGGEQETVQKKTLYNSNIHLYSHSY